MAALRLSVNASTPPAVRIVAVLPGSADTLPQERFQDVGADERERVVRQRQVRGDAEAAVEPGLGREPAEEREEGERDRRTRLQRLDLASGRRELLKTVGPSDLTGVVQAFPIILSRDEKSYAYTSRRYRSLLFLVEGAH